MIVGESGLLDQWGVGAPGRDGGAAIRPRGGARGYGEEPVEWRL